MTGAAGSRTVLPTAAAVVSAACVCLSAYPYGLLIQPDSTAFLSVAERLLDGHGFTIFDGSPYVFWPPMYPLLLAAGRLLGLPLSTVALIVNAGAMAITVWLAGRWLARHVERPAMVVLGQIAVVSAIGLLAVYPSVWTEASFIAFVMGGLLGIDRYLAERTPRCLVLAALSCAVAGLTRQLGVAATLAGVVMLLRDEGAVWPRLRRALAFAVTGVAPLALWSLLTAEGMVAERAASKFSAAAVVESIVEMVSIWVMPGSLPAGLRHAGVLLALAALVALRATLPRPRRRAVDVMTWFLIAYTGLVIIVFHTINLPRPDHRYLSPLAAPLILWTFAIVDGAIVASPRWSVRLRHIVVAGLAVWLVYPVIHTSKGIGRLAADTGRPSWVFNGPDWRQSELAAYLRAHGPDGTLYSNVPDGVWATTGLPARATPRKYVYMSVHRPPDLERFIERVKGGERLQVAWFTATARKAAFTLPELCEHVGFSVVTRTQDGLVLRVTPTPAASAAVPECRPSPARAELER